MKNVPCVYVCCVLSGWMPIVFDLIPSYVIFGAESSSKRINNIHYYALGIFTTSFVRSFIFPFCSPVHEALFPFSPPSLCFCSVEKWLKCNLYVSLCCIGPVVRSSATFSAENGHKRQNKWDLHNEQWPTLKWVRENVLVSDDGSAKRLLFSKRMSAMMTKLKKKRRTCRDDSNEEDSVSICCCVPRLSIFAYVDAICSCQMMIDHHHQDNDTNKNRNEKEQKKHIAAVPNSHCIDW